MNNDYINISSIETHFDKVIRANVCKQSYAGTLPSTLSEDIDDYVVIDAGAGINDFHAYGSGIINIFLYAQPIGNGMKNVAQLSKMEKALNMCLRENLFDSKYYSVANEEAYGDTGYDSTYNMHYIIKAVYLTVLGYDDTADDATTKAIRK